LQSLSTRETSARLREIEGGELLEIVDEKTREEALTRSSFGEDGTEVEEEATRRSSWKETDKSSMNSLIKNPASTRSCSALLDCAAPSTLV
jgi:hypothetical protein